MFKQNETQLEPNRIFKEARVHDLPQFDTNIVHPTLLRQVSSPHNSQSISPIRTQGESNTDYNYAYNAKSSQTAVDQQIQMLKQQIESRNLIVKEKSSQNLVLQQKLSEAELNFGLQLEKMQNNFVKQLEQDQIQIREKQQEAVNYIQEINQLKQQNNKIKLLIDQTKQENNLLREQCKPQPNNCLQQGKQEDAKQKEVIKCLEDQNKYYEEEVNKYIAENQQLIIHLNNLNQQVKQQQQEINKLTEYNEELEQMVKNKEEEIKQKQQLILSNDYQKKEQQDFEKIQEELEMLSQELMNLKNELQSKSLELQKSASKMNQMNQRINQLEQQNQELQSQIESQAQQINSKQKTINLLNDNLQATQKQEIQYQQLLENFNTLKEKLSQQQVDQLTNSNAQSQLQSQLVIFQKQSQQQQQKIEKLTIMLENRLNEIEFWQNKCYELENADLKGYIEQLIKENEFLKQRCNILEINIKENSGQQDNLKQNLKNDKSHLQIRVQENQKKQMSSPKNQRFANNDGQVREFNSKSKLN